MEECAVEFCDWARIAAGCYSGVDFAFGGRGGGGRVGGGVGETHREGFVGIEWSAGGEWLVSSGDVH